MTHLVWYRNDCRVRDHAALTEACDRARRDGRPVVALFLWTPDQWRRHDYGLARHFSWATALSDLDISLARLGIELHVRRSTTWTAAVDQLIAFARDRSATDLYRHREFGWDEVRRDDRVADRCAASGIRVHTYDDRITWEPTQLLTGQGEMYRVFTPFHKRWRQECERRGLSAPLPAPAPVAEPRRPGADLPAVNWTGRAERPLTETEAHEQLDHFLATAPRYREQRDLPGVDGTSGLSAALANGAISLRQCLYTASTHPDVDADGVQKWIAELVWREFYQYLLCWRPELARHEPFYPRWDRFPWSDNADHLERWRDGTTGVPIVDAGMRQLAQTGWMHNRVRMIVAMYLVKLLHQDWRAGEAWFADQLLDIDFASNNGGWQWCASTGVDAAPYFRIFNPHTQSERFDPDGRYIRRWVPELAPVEARAIHRPDRRARQYCGYPEPLVDYKTAREETLRLFKTL